MQRRMSTGSGRAGTGLGEDPVALPGDEAKAGRRADLASRAVKKLNHISCFQPPVKKHVA